MMQWLARGTRDKAFHALITHRLTGKDRQKRVDSGPAANTIHRLWIKLFPVCGDVDGIRFVHGVGVAWRGCRLALSLMPMLSTDLRERVDQRSDRDARPAPTGNPAVADFSGRR